MSTADNELPPTAADQTPVLIPEESELGQPNDVSIDRATAMKEGQPTLREFLKQQPNDLQQAEEMGSGHTTGNVTADDDDLAIKLPKTPLSNVSRRDSHNTGNFSTHSSSGPPVTNVPNTSNEKMSHLNEDSSHKPDIPLSENSPPGVPGATKESILRKYNELNLETLIWDDSSRDRTNTERSTIFDLDGMISRLLNVGKSRPEKNLCLSENDILSICSAARNLFLSQPILLELNAPINIIGDIHGQFTDLLRLFEMSGFPPAANYLFLGDYVDRGKQSLETILLLLCYKLKYPETFFLLRGNHECANVSRIYGFYDECKRRSSVKIWKTFTDVFNCLPIAAVIAERIFCVHGGLSPKLLDMNDIRNIARPTEVPDQGLLNDLLWSDPANIKDWEPNDDRGVSWFFGRKIVSNFLKRHNLDLVCRAHMVVEGGYEFFGERNLVTVFSAPNVSLWLFPTR
ncbi:hypothetical protein N7520_004403 [Penicillium odoratum]|uniref:uncharacterized protein n=1 Tax=Penicillium odoratum TaxID=1167516 RepID=UPI00254768B5|nr:uncharacterized protein N7520_004403 [Penicillium odoratum]KAJ5764844.1 hypothetical protein N7520_004403 [Penicillium odoratum]